MNRQRSLNELYLYLSNNFNTIEPENTIRMLTRIKKLWNPATHTRTNIESIIDQIEFLWEAGTLSRQLLGLLLTNLIYDKDQVIHIRRIISIYSRNRSLELFEKRQFFDAL